MDAQKIGKSIYQKYRDRIRLLLENEELLFEEILIEQVHVEGVTEFIVNPGDYKISDDERKEVTKAVKSIIILLLESDLGIDYGKNANQGN